MEFTVKAFLNQGYNAIKEKKLFPLTTYRSCPAPEGSGFSPGGINAPDDINSRYQVEHLWRLI